MNKIIITKSILGMCVLICTFGQVAAMGMIAGTDSMLKNKVSPTTDVIMMKNTMMKNEVTTGNATMGSRGEVVVNLQNFLIAKGFLVLPAGAKTGYYGVMTKKAVMMYQESEGITVTGFLGAKTRMSIQEKMKTMSGDTIMKKDIMINDSTMIKKSSMIKSDTMMKPGVYELHTAEKVMNVVSGSVVLFFKAGWCPTCRAVDTDIKANLAKIPAAMNILEVDYDDSTALKQKYGVTYQHTFVQVDKDGTMIKKWSGSPTLSALVAEVK